jgi:hypothetical protein
MCERPRERLLSVYDFTGSGETRAGRGGATLGVHQCDAEHEEREKDEDVAERAHFLLIRPRRHKLRRSVLQQCGPFFFWVVE